MSVHDALSRTTLHWHTVRGARPGWELRAGSDVVATAHRGRLQMGAGVFRTTSARGGRTVLVNVATGARIATVRELTSGPAAINVGEGRYRLTRQGVLPVRWEVTRDLGGPQILEIFRLGRVLRVKAGDQLDDAPAGEVDLLVALAGMRMLGLLAPEDAAAAVA